MTGSVRRLRPPLPPGLGGTSALRFRLAILASAGFDRAGWPRWPRRTDERRHRPRRIEERFQLLAFDRFFCDQQLGDRFELVEVLAR